MLVWRSEGWDSILISSIAVTRRVATLPCDVGKCFPERYINSQELCFDLRRIVELVLGYPYIFTLITKAVLKTHTIEIVVCLFLAQGFSSLLCSYQPLLATSFWQWPFCSFSPVSLFLEGIEPVLVLSFIFWHVSFLREDSLLLVLSDKWHFHLINMGLGWSWWNIRRIYSVDGLFSPQIIPK